MWPGSTGMYAVAPEMDEMVSRTCRRQHSSDFSSLDMLSQAVCRPNALTGSAVRLRQRQACMQM